jgi:hypothetical protein
MEGTVQGACLRPSILEFLVPNGPEPAWSAYSLLSHVGTSGALMAVERLVRLLSTPEGWSGLAPGLYTWPAQIYWSLAVKSYS